MKKVEMSQILETPYVKNLHDQLDDFFQNKKLGKVELPYVLKNQVLMAPGTWNGKFYNSEAIRRGFKNSDWTSRKVLSVFAEHRDQDKSNSIDDWLGFVVSPKMSGDQVLGDVIVYDEATAIKLETVKNLSEGIGPDRNIFGISPRLLADENTRGQITDFVFENFSLVFNPAVKKAFINNSQKKEGSNMSGQATTESLAEEVKALKEQVEKLTHPDAPPESPEKKKKMPPMPPTMKNAEGEGEDSKPEEGGESGDAGDKGEGDSGSSEGDSSKESGKEEKKDAKLSDKELADIVTLAEFPEFAGGYRKEHPTATLSEIAQAFKTSKNSADVKQLKEQLAKQTEKMAELEKRLNEPEEKHANIQLSEVDKTIKENPELMKEEALDNMMMNQLRNPGVNLLAEIN